MIVASPDYLTRRGTPQIAEDLHDHDCLSFNFKRAAPTWPFRKDGRDYSLTVKGSVEANNGETLGQLAAEGVGITRVGAETVIAAIRSGELVLLLEQFNRDGSLTMDCNLLTYGIKRQMPSSRHERGMLRPLLTRTGSQPRSAD